MEFNSYQIDEIVAHMESNAPNRKIGVEIECLIMRDTFSDLRAYCSDRGVILQQEGYNHTTRQHWKMVHDVSIRSTEGYTGAEFVSPPLEASKMAEQLHVICDGLKFCCDAKVNRSCGLHVHHDARKGYTWRRLRNLVYLYAKSERALDLVCPPSRRGNSGQYCSTIKSHLDDLVSEGGVVDNGSWRYKKLNLQSFIRQGTVEYRHQGASVDFSKIFWWIALTSAIHTRGKKVVKRTDGYDNPLCNVLLQIKWARRNGSKLDAVSIGAKHLLDFTNDRLRFFDHTPLPLAYE